LALTTAGDYLSRTSDSFGDFLQSYEQSWQDLQKYADELWDYEDRTLYTTWNISFDRVQTENEDAANLMRLLAYFDNDKISLGLLQSGSDRGPEWFQKLIGKKIEFDKAMMKLQDYSLIEAGEGNGKYSLHKCVHDWTLNELNQQLQPELVDIAMHCIAQSVTWESEQLYWEKNREIEGHGLRLQERRIAKVIEQSQTSEQDTRDLFMIGYLYTNQGKLAEAEQMYMRALKGKEKTLGVKHTSTLDVVNNLGLLYSDQGKLAKAKQMYMRALKKYEKTLGVKHTSTLNTVNNLGLLYSNQGKLAEAKQMYMRALKGYEKAHGSNDQTTILISRNLEILHETITKF